MKYFNNTNINKDKNNDSYYKISVVFLFILIIIILTTKLVGINYKKVEKRMVIYPNTKKNLVVKDIKVNIIEKNNTACSKDAICTLGENYKLVVNVNDQKYELNAGNKKYKKIQNTKKYIYAGINENKIEVGIARNYKTTEMIGNMGKFIWEIISNFYEGISKWMDENINWTREQ